ncbi:MAG TPA: PSD1 and planctomycete cytochrome C domain-containing protein [Caulifigura sp.]|nr:PSD1 and planctomycete cytochrome C domain-containing protein [Caulifigura sp.]
MWVRQPFCLLLGLLGGLRAISAAAAIPDQIEFNRDVRPILSENCFACHGFDPKHREAGLRLDTFEGVTADRDGSIGIVPGSLEGSEVWRRITSTDPDEVMPPATSKKPRLNEEQLAILKRWIEQGAKYQRHWAFEPPKKTQVPSGQKHLIEHFVEARLEKEGLKPSPAANPVTLIRRVSLDLIGLPPTPAEVDAFVAASAKDPDAAWSELVDRLLASPHYGERWGRWWLDQARYADSNGYSIDAPRQIWKYRDWVVEALNKDQSFDQFTVEQLAGDLLPNATVDQKVATGFHRNTQINQEGGIDKEQFRIDSVFDRVATTGTVWLGLTIGCAQCHDHKFDPIGQAEYYQLFAFLNNQDEPNLTVYEPGVDVPRLNAEFAGARKQLESYLASNGEKVAGWESGLSPEAKKGLSKRTAKIVAVASEKRTLDQKRMLYEEVVPKDSEFDSLNRRFVELEREVDKGVSTMVMQELTQPRKSHVFIKGDFTRPADEVTPGVPSVLHPLPASSSQPNRLDLARWLVSRDNPLTARVIVNRVWQQYFGRGIVETENDFGSQGTLPSHPELLDSLAIEFQEQGWSLKKLHRLIVMSRTYRQSSSDRPDLREKDPNNTLLGRQNRLRLDAEIVRDVALAASGLLCEKMGGPPVFPPIPAGVTDLGQSKRAWTVSPGEDRYRRALYTFIYRATPPPALSVFDAPEGSTTCTRRIRSNTPLQALTLMNDEAFFEFAISLEKTIQSKGLVEAFRRCTSRAPSPEELLVLKRLDSLGAARAMLNLDETVTRE